MTIRPLKQNKDFTFGLKRNCPLLSPRWSGSDPPHLDKDDYSLMVIFYYAINDEESIKTERSDVKSFY